MPLEVLGLLQRLERRNRAIPQAGEDTEYWINPPTFEIEICGSYDKDKVCEVLHAVGWLLKAENGRRWQHQRKPNGTASRYYVLINEAPPETE